MGHGKETPRQKMIGMMYLVLTALLALNVSKDILNAFVLVDEGVTKTTENFAEKNEMIYDEFDKLALSNPTKVKPWKLKADDVRKRANELFEHMHTLKLEMIKLADGPDAPSIDKDKKIDGNKINSKDNTDKPAQIMVGDNNDKEGKKLKKMIEEYREFLLSLVDKKDVGTRSSIELTLDTKDPAPSAEGQHHSWESEHFEHLPLIAVTTIMSNLQNNVRNAESEAVRYLYNQIEAGSFKFNKLEPVVIANSSYVLQNNEYKAEVFIAAQDTTRRPSIYIGNYKTVTENGKVDYVMEGRYDSLKIDPNTGRGIFQKTAGAPQIYKWAGIIQMRATDGSIMRFPFKQEYQVGAPMTVISPTKMNVFYIGVENPVNISASGIPADKLKAEINNGTITPSGDAWVVNPSKAGNAEIIVYAEMDKKKQKMGSMMFRVKPLPDPVAKVNKMKGGSLEKNILAVQQIVEADMENFEFDAKFQVTEFTMSAKVKGFDIEKSSKSNRITQEMRDMINGLGKGDKVTFNDVKAKGPDGKFRDLNGIIIKIK